MTVEYIGSIHFTLNLEPLDQTIVLKHSNASIMLSPREFPSGVMSFLALLKARSHSQDVTGQVNISKVQRCRVGKASSISG
jgi:hypothetical protein